MKGLSLRGRLLAAFVLVALPPLGLLAVAVNELLSRTFEQAAENRLAQALAAGERELERLRQQAEQRVAAVAERDLPSLVPNEEGDYPVATSLARQRELEALEIVDGTGRLISSHHWPAGFGLSDRDQVFAAPSEGVFRIEKAAEPDDYGVRERLAVTSAREARWREAPVLVRGGYFLDGELLGGLSTVMGVEMALHDGVRQQWFARRDSPLLRWKEPPLEGRGGRPQVMLDEESYRWSAARLQPGLWLVVATPRSALAEVTAGVRRLAFGVAAVAALGAVAAAFVLSGRIARPVRDLAGAAHAVAAGEPPEALTPRGLDEIAELARAFNTMTEQLRLSRERLLQAERVAAWREMARRLAHELKNPLFPIQLSIETLRRALEQEELASGSDDRFRELFLESSDTILEELRSLRKIIEEFSEFARMPRPELAPLDLNAVVERSVELYRPRADGVVMETDLAASLPAVKGDRDLLGRALGNLIGNALDVLPEGGRLHVRTGAQPGAVTVQVEDSGPGLTEEQKTRLFTPYYTTKKGGTGLGLAIVQGIVSDHGGRIEVRSAPGQGTSFTLVLPAAEPAP